MPAEDTVGFWSGLPDEHNGGGAVDGVSCRRNRRELCVPPLEGGRSRALLEIRTKTKPRGVSAEPHLPLITAAERFSGRDKENKRNGERS